MAVDSAGKRYSILNFGNPIITPLIIPDGTVAAADKYHFLNLYSGISLLAAPIFAGTIPDYSLTEGEASEAKDLSTYFSGATSYSIAPAVEAGWSFSTSTGILTIDPLVVGVYGTYVVTGTNAGGSDASNAFSVTVTEVVADDETPTGGFWFDYDRELRKRKQERKERERLEEEAKQIQDRLEREIALEFRKQETELARVKELKRLAVLAEEHRKAIHANLSDKVIKAADRAVRQGNYSAMEAFEREVFRAREEEEFLIMALNLILND